MSADAKEALGRRLVDETPEGRLTLGMVQDIGCLGDENGARALALYFTDTRRWREDWVAAKASIGRAVTASTIKRGATQEVAEAVAAKAVSKLPPAPPSPLVRPGQSAVRGGFTRDTVLGMSFDELAASDTFRQAFARIDQDQQTAYL